MAKKEITEPKWKVPGGRVRHRRIVYEHRLSYQSLCNRVGAFFSHLAGWSEVGESLPICKACEKEMAKISSH